MGEYSYHSKYYTAKLILLFYCLSRPEVGKLLLYLCINKTIHQKKEVAYILPISQGLLVFSPNLRRWC